MGEKTCKKCGRTFPLSDKYFAKRKDSKDGYRNECKECTKKYIAKYRQEHREKIIEINKRYNELNREKRLEYKRANKTRLNQYDKLYRKKNREKELIYRRKYREENQELYRIARMRYRSKKKELPHELTVDEWEACKEYFNHCCAYCGKHESELEHTIEQDHFIPVSKQGSYTADNIVPACRSCNASKLDNYFEKWYREQPFYDKKREEKILVYISMMKSR